MKKILFVRHAHSDWGNNSLGDHDRPLSRIGEGQALLMAERMNRKNVLPNIFITSSALRALDTCKIIKNELGENSNMLVDPKIYNDGADGILKLIESLDDDINFISIFGHNPSMHQIANQISNKPIYKFSPCSMILSSSNISKWSDFHFTETNFLMYDFPGSNKEHQWE